MLSTIKFWIYATRPKTLFASISPVALGLILAKSQHSFSNFYAIITILCALLIQIGTNFANDYIDFKKGADTVHRKGPTRMVQAGYISVHHMKWATFTMFLLAFLLGLILCYRGSWPILCIGLVSIFLGYFYTAGPYALAYTGLADIIAFLFFGPVAVSGTYYIQHLTVSFESILLGVGVGLLATALLSINNIRDQEEDKHANKKTLVVRFGQTFGFIEYSLCIVISTSILWILSYSIIMIYVLLAYTIFCMHMIRKTLTASKIQLNTCLSGTGLTLFLYPLIYGIRYIIS